ncbi:hypothetical protein B0H13DRAFT_1989024 [Mycena leptocephala]|nr:hypothetical protein B0H13DRAFT_1989024 [Mycena leptocephala]
MTAQTWWKGASALPGGPLSLPPLIPGTSLDFTHLMGRNDAPLDSEIPFIRDIISDAQDRVDALDGQIRDLKAVLSELVRRRDETAVQVRQHRVILSPLICEILCLTLDSDDEYDMSKPRPPPPWRLGHVCRSWRLAALGYTQFWSSIVIPAAASRRNVDPQVADLVVAHCSRWVALRLDVYCSRSSDALSWLLPVNGRLSSLEKLEVINGRVAVIPDVFSDAPNLRHITHYRGSYRGRSLLNILHATPNLVQCSVSFADTLDPDGLSPVTLPHLRRFCMDDPTYLVHFTAPSLENLICLENGPVNVCALLSFAHRSSCLLKKLVLIGCEISSELITVLRGLPSLRCLVLETESAHQEQTTLFAALTLSGTFPIPSDSFLVMVHSRIRPNHASARLTRLRVFDEDDSSGVCTASALKILRDEGLDAASLGVQELQAEIFF